MNEVSREQVERALLTAALGVVEGIPGALLLFLRLEAEVAKFDEDDAARERARQLLAKHGQLPGGQSDRRDE